MARVLSRSFYRRPTLKVARDLLGKTLVRELDGEVLRGRIAEVEAYVGEKDSACHAARGPTARNRVMYGPPGHAYVYFTYGMHWLLNLVSEREGFPAAILIRAIDPLSGIETMRSRRAGRRDAELTNGPAKLCQALGIEGSHSGADVVEGCELRVEEGERVEDREVSRGPRIGIAYARQEDLEAPWRLWIASSPSVSRPR